MNTTGKKGEMWYVYITVRKTASYKDNSYLTSNIKRRTVTGDKRTHTKKVKCHAHIKEAEMKVDKELINFQATPGGE